MKTDKSIDKFLYIGGWILILSISLILILFKVSQKSLSLPPCIFHLMTGFYCPGCGGTRSVLALIHGKPLKCFYYHPFVIYTVILGGYFMLSQTIEHIIRLFKSDIKIGLSFRDIYLWAALAIVIINCIAKNILLILGHPMC